MRPSLGIKEHCCGCGSCVNACPTKALSMSCDEYGFLCWTCAEDKCIGCGRCERVCPFIAEPSSSEPLISYAVVNKEESVLMASSSGGVFHSIALRHLKKGGVVFGAEMGADFCVAHVRVDSVNELERIQRSKYVQSDLGTCFIQVAKDLKMGRPVLFSGVPCQVAALRNFLGASSAACNNLLTCEVVCHGVPSQRFFSDYLECLRKRFGGLQEYRFRAKREPKNGMNWFFSFRDSRGKVRLRNWPEDSFNYAYMMGAIYRDSCYVCPFAKLERVADMTLCDYWHWEEFLGGKFNRDASVSAVLLNTERGVGAFQDACGSLAFVPTDSRNVAEHNSCLMAPTPKNSERKRTLSDWVERGYGYIDARFMREHRMQRLKYALMRHLPRGVLRLRVRSRR